MSVEIEALQDEISYRFRQIDLESKNYSEQMENIIKDYTTTYKGNCYFVCIENDMAVYSYAYSFIHKGEIVLVCGSFAYEL